MGRNLPLKTRRRNASGLTPRLQRAWAGRNFISLGNGRRSAVTLGTGVSSFRVFYKVPGTAGNSITVAIVNGGAAPVVTVVGNAVTVTTPVASTTANQVIDAINRTNSPALMANLWAQLPAGSTGTGFVAAVGATTLTGGTAAG